MQKYQKITFWENKNRQKYLNEFKEFINKYFNSIGYGTYGDIIDNKNSLVVREKINKNVNKAQDFMASVNIAPIVEYTAPPMAGGYTKRLDPFENIFNLQQYNLDKQVLVDSLNNAIGIYENDLFNSYLRTFNPFFWLIELINFVTSLPSKLLADSGLINKSSKNGSMILKIIKFLSDLIVWGFGSYYAFFKIIEPFFKIFSK